MYLFAIYLQPLLDKLSVSFPQAILNAYADDISMFVENEAELMAIAEVFRSYSDIAGAMLNVRKTTALMIGNVNLTVDSEWLQIENEIKILGITFTDKMSQTVDKNWTSVLAKFQRALWMNNVRALNLIQKVILINTFVSSRLWYVASTLPLPNKFAGKFVSQIGSFIWHGRTDVRVAFEVLILPKNRGGLNLHSPPVKARALIVNRMLQIADTLPFFFSFLRQNDNPPFINAVPWKFQHIRTVIQDSAYLPPQMVESLSSCSINQFLLERLKDAKILRMEPVRDWRNVFQNIHSKSLTSKQRSVWYITAHKKIRTNELLYNQQRRMDPFCERCPTEVESVVHKYFKCGVNAQIWQFQRALILRMDRRLGRLEAEDWIYPTLKQLRRPQRIEVLKAIGIFLCYLDETSEDDRSIQNYEFYLTCNLS